MICDPLFFPTINNSETDPTIHENCCVYSCHIFLIHVPHYMRRFLSLKMYLGKKKDFIMYRGDYM